MSTLHSSAAARFVSSVISCILASCGLRFDTRGAHTLVFVVLAAGGWTAQRAFIEGAPAADATTRVYAYFAALFAVRYVFLFASFVPGGIAERLIARFGEARGWRVYELCTSWMFFQRGLSFAPLVALAPWSLLDGLTLSDEHLAITRAVCIGLGVALAIIGFFVNTASMLVVGLDVYFYKDLFLRRPVGKFEVRGPYKYLANPMYGLGQCSGYGVALMVGSVLVGYVYGASVFIGLEARGSRLPFGVGVQVGFLPRTIGAYIFTGVQAEL